MQFHRFFTLIELLIVIAIISILTAIAIPATGKSRDRAKAAFCANNMGQIYLAVTQYADDHRGRFPDPVSVGACSAAAISRWSGHHFATISYTGGRATSCYRRLPGRDGETLGLAAALQPYIPSTPEIWRCPGAREPFARWDNTYRYHVGNLAQFSVGVYWRELGKNKVGANRIDEFIILQDEYMYQPAEAATVGAASTLIGGYSGTRAVENHLRSAHGSVFSREANRSGQYGGQVLTAGGRVMSYAQHDKL